MAKDSGNNSNNTPSTPTPSPNQGSPSGNGQMSTQSAQPTEKVVPSIKEMEKKTARKESPRKTTKGTEEIRGKCNNS